MGPPVTHVQGYPQRTRLQRRLYRIYTICFFIIVTHRNCKVVSLFDINRSYLRQKLDFSLDLKSFRSSLQSHPLWVNPVELKQKYILRIRRTSLQTGLTYRQEKRKIGFRLKTKFFFCNAQILKRFSSLDPNPLNMQNENQTIEQIFALENKFKFHLVNYH